MRVNSVMLTGADVEVKNARNVRPNAREDVEFSIAAICLQILKMIFGSRTHPTFMRSTNPNTLLHRYELYISLEHEKQLYFGFSHKTGP